MGLSEDRAAAIAKRMRAEPSEHCTVLKFSPDIGSVASEMTGALHGSNEWSKVRGAMDEDTFLFKFWGESSVSRFHSSPFVWLGLVTRGEEAWAWGVAVWAELTPLIGLEAQALCPVAKRVPGR